MADKYKDEPEGGERCKVCFWMRIENTAITAKRRGFDGSEKSKISGTPKPQGGFDGFGTTLSVNAWKDVDLINNLGKDAAERFRLSFFDFGLGKEEIKKICYAEKELAKKHNLYRQKYCGCMYGIQNQK